MLTLRVVSRSLVLVAVVAACSSSGSATKAPVAPTHGGATPTSAAGAPATPAGPQLTAPGNPGDVPTVPVSDADPWQRNASEFQGQNSHRYAYPCPPNGTVATIWGTDSYTDDSSVCAAGVHVGVITAAVGGYVVIEIRPGQDGYTGSVRNGVTSYDYGAWAGSYVVIKP